MASYYPLLIFLFLFLSLSSLTSSSDTISPSHPLTGNQTIVSQAGAFELGFFNPGSSGNHYIGIWYKNIPHQTIIWVANRATPVSDPSAATLTISPLGHLLLLDRHSNTTIWSALSSTSNSTAVLLDTGNLLLRDATNTSAISWQSFDHPTDTWVPGGWLGMNKLTGEYQHLTSWRNREDPSPGPFTDSIDSSGINQYLLQWNDTVPYWKSGPWTGKFFTGLPSMSENPRFINIFVDDDRGRYFKLSLLDNQTITRNVMDPNGQIQQWLWLENAQQWELFWSEPDNPCDVYSVCGAFGVCSQNSATLCSCSPGFDPASPRDWNLSSWSDGCRRRTHLQCNQSDGFVTMENTRGPGSPQVAPASSSAEKCRIACLKNCNCSAYAFTDRCSMWVGEIRGLQTWNNAGTLYLRLAASDIPPPSAWRHQSSNKRILIVKIVISLAAGILLLLSIIWLAWSCEKRWRQGSRVEGLLVSFTYGDLQRVTKSFSARLGGGSFGSVFRGELSDSTPVAVKKLEGMRQGDKQFRAEMSTLSTIQHVNLVRLRGFCCEGAKRLLVYDFMPNGSLDHHLFDHSKTLDWSTRYNVILGIARGLAYIHEKCRECIIHCDVKPENILLDSCFCPKVSDFGLAKLVDRDLSRVLTTVRGTVGYLAPEWIAGLPITPKADVYSYGMMLFEIVSGRRNTDLEADDADGHFFPIWAARKMVVGDVVSLLDERLGGDADMVELIRVCRVAYWCIQDSEAHRPAMGLVVQILEGVLEVRMPPIPGTLQHLAQYDQDSSMSERS